MGNPRVEVTSREQLKLAGDYTFATIGKVWPTLNQFLKDAPQGGHLRCDLSGLNKADSTCLALLVTLLRRTNKSKQTIQFIAMPPQLIALAKVSGVEQLLREKLING